MFRKLMACSCALAVFFVLPLSAQAAEFQIDSNHSTISFKIRHLFSKVQGTFKEVEGSFSHDPENIEASSAEAVIQVASIDTGVEKRDAHLLSADFFEAEKYPTITFKSTGVTKVSDEEFQLTGDFTMHGVTRPVTLDVEYHGVGSDPWGNVRSGYTATTTIDRKDFGLDWNQVVEAGKLLGDEVEITLEIEGLQQ